MTNMRKFETLLVGCLLYFVPFVVFGEWVDCGNFKYDVDFSKKEGKLCKYSGTDTEVAIPSTFTATQTYYENGEYKIRVHTITVVSVGLNNGGSYYSSYNRPFGGNQQLRKVTIPETVKVIGLCAFEGCSSLESVTIPNSISNIGNEAFSGCSSLKEIEINGDGSVVICYKTFQGCTALEKCVIGDGVCKIEQTYGYGLSSCGKLKEVWFGNKIETIPPSLFSGNKSLKTIYFSSVTNIGSSAFSGCTNLSEISLSKIEGFGNDAFRGCTALTEIDLTSARRIGQSAFSECNGLSSVVTSAALSYLGGSAFANCKKMESATITGDGSLYIEDSVFSGCTNLETVVLGAGIADIADGRAVSSIGLGPTTYCGMFVGCSRLKSVDVQTSRLNRLPSYMFFQTPIERLTVISQIKEIGMCAFSECNCLTIVSGDFSAVTNIESRAFLGCTSLAVMPPFEGVRVIGDSAFCNCVALASQVDLLQCEVIGGSAFNGCSSLTAVEIPKVITIASGAYYGCKSLARIEMPCVESIGDSAFYGCSSLEGVAMPLITNIGYQAFRNCLSLTNALMPNVTSLGREAFADCWSLTQISLPSKTNSVEYCAFSGCSSLTNVSMPKVAGVGESAFYGCKSLTSVTLPKSVMEIWGYAFYNCSSLINVYFEGSPPNIRGSYPFRYVKSGATGTYTAAYKTEWEAVIDANGYWNGLKMQMRNTAYSITYNANGGIGTMDAQTFEEGKEQKLSKNLFKKDGYVFQGWATVEDGEVVYKDEAEVTVESDLTLYAVWDNPPLTLTAESANWSSGSITLCCTDADTSGAAHTYTLSYKDETTGEWNDVDGAKNVSVGADGKALLTDSVFSSRLGGIPPVKYRVKDENGRVTEECVTRTKYGVFVGLSRWSPSAYKKSLANLGDASNARKFRRLAVEQGSFDGNNITMLVDGEATTNAVSNAFADKARRAVAGDVCVFYFSTHGGVSENNGAAALAFYDGRYDDEALASDIARLDAANKGIAVIGIVHACHSVAMYDNPSLDFERTKWYLKNGLAQCSPNVAWITSAARVKESSYGTFNIFMLDYGWEEGFAGTGDSLTFGELAQYTKSRYDAVFSGIVFDHDHGSYSKEVNIENTTILSRVMAGRRGSHDTNAVVPATPQGVAASQGLCNTRVGVSWNPVADATAYTVFYRVGDGEKWTGCCWRYAERPRDGKYEYWKDAEDLEKECSYSFKGRDENSPVFFAVKAFNGAGVSDLSDIVKGWMDYKGWWGGVKEWLFECHPSIVSAAAGDVIAAAGLTAACGTKTIEKCYALGIDPEDPNDDLKIADFEMKDGKPATSQCGSLR